MVKCRECNQHIGHNEAYWWCRIDEPPGEMENISNDIEAMCVASGMPYAYVRETLDKKGKKTKPHWHYWIYGYRCELREWSRKYVTGSKYMVKYADESQDADCAVGIVNYCSKTGAPWYNDGIPDDVIEEGLKVAEVHRKENVSVFRQIENLIPNNPIPLDIVRTVVKFFQEREVTAGYNQWKTYCDMFILKKCGPRAVNAAINRLENDCCSHYNNASVYDPFNPNIELTH